jgi:uncharacterized protein
VKCFYHNDLDGRCAGYLVYKFNTVEDYYEEEGYKGEYIEIDYSKKFPLDKIKDSEVVYIVDFSISPDEMEKLLKITSNVIWIDHHITAIEKYKDFPQKIDGLRYDGLSGAMLTWIYLTSFTYVNIEEIAKNAPFFVKLVSDWDTWTFKYGDDTRYFKTATDSMELEPTNPNWAYVEAHTNDMIETGKTMIKFRDSWAKEYMKNGFEVAFEEHKCFAVNLANCNSEYFKSIDNGDYDILIPFSFNGTKWTYSMYSKTIDVSEIAKKYGGGGHKGAAGFIQDKFILNKGDK